MLSLFGWSSDEISTPDQFFAQIDETQRDVADEGKQEGPDQCPVEQGGERQVVALSLAATRSPVAAQQDDDADRRDDALLFV